jgi:transcriptional regulator GlxA family with amidase domain
MGYLLHERITHQPMVTMSRKEVLRAGLLKASVAGQMTNAQLALALHLSVRHVQRLYRAGRRRGPAASFARPARPATG